MSTNENDLRVRRTLDAIHAALAALVVEKGLDSITVGDLTRRAGINRTTFYRHYRDKFQAIEAILVRQITEMNDAMGPIQSRRSRFPVDEVPEPWIRFFKQIEANAELYRAILHSSEGAWFQARLRKHVEKILKVQDSNVRPSAQQHSSFTGMPTEITIAFSANLFVSVAIWWLETQQQYKAEQVATWLRHFFLWGYIGKSNSR